jgi:hypothetical protein
MELTCVSISEGARAGGTRWSALSNSQVALRISELQLRNRRLTVPLTCSFAHLSSLFHRVRPPGGVHDVAPFKSRQTAERVAFHIWDHLTGVHSQVRVAEFARLRVLASSFSIIFNFRAGLEQVLCRLEEVTLQVPSAYASLSGVEFFPLSEGYVDGVLRSARIG